MLNERTRQRLSPLLGELIFYWIEELRKQYPDAHVYLVGGAVRDAAFGRNDQKDYDFVIRNIPAETLEKFLSQRGSVDFVGRTFGVFKFSPNNWPYTEAIDIALPRTDHAFGTGGYKAVTVESRETLPIESDLERRDFTMNAMAWDVQAASLIDPFCGLADIRDGILRAVGDPKVRFREDYSRMLRALRFTCQFNLKFDPTTWGALLEFMPHLNDAVDGERTVPYEIISKELIKTFVADPVRAFDLYDTSSAFSTLILELLPMRGCPQQPNFHSEGDVWSHTRLALEKLRSKEFQEKFPGKEKSALVVFGTLLHDIGKPPTLKVLSDGPNAGQFMYHGHDKVGSEIVRTICHRLKLASLPKDSALHVSCDDVSWIVANHLLILNAKVEQMRASTIERYFFNDHVPGRDLLAVILADSLATIPKGEKPNLDRFHDMQRRIEEIRGVQGQRRGRYRDIPAPILSGEDIMKEFHLEQSTKIGKLLREIRELQLRGTITTKAEAFAHLKIHLLTEDSP